MSHKQSGFSLFEILLALSLMSFALMGLSAYQLKTLEYAKSAYIQNEAINQLQESVWLVMHHFSLKEQEKHEHLPGMQVISDNQDVSLSWAAPIIFWDCGHSLDAQQSCIHLMLKLS